MAKQVVVGMVVTFDDEVPDEVARQTVRRMLQGETRFPRGSGPRRSWTGFQPGDPVASELIRQAEEGWQQTRARMDALGPVPEP